LIKQLRPYLSDVAAAVGISTRIVPHQLRHTYATEMIRAGVSLPALMTFLSHLKAEMTMKYVQVAGNDLRPSSTWSAPNRGIWRHSRRPLPFRLWFWKASVILYSSLNTLWRCSVVRCLMALPDVGSIGPPIA
jgi:hypothetical protein